MTSPKSAMKLPKKKKDIPPEVDSKSLEDFARKADADPIKGFKKQAFKCVIKNTFTMPPEEYDSIAKLQERCARANGFEPSKAELLRAGVAALHELNPAELGEAVKRLVPVRRGRKI